MGLQTTLRLVAWLFLAYPTFVNASQEKIVLSNTTSHLQYELSGTILNQTNGIWEFDVWVKGSQWCIRTRSAGVLGLARFWETGSTNGQEVYYSVQWPPRSAALDTEMNRALGGRSTNKNVSVSQDYALGIIESNAVPMEATDGLTPKLWLMFASAAWWPAQDTNRLIPVYDVQASKPFSPQYQKDARWSLNDQFPFLPQEVVYWNDGYHRQGTNHDIVKLLPQNAPYHQGFTNAFFSVTGFTNLGSMRLPMGFQYVQFRPKVSGISAADLAIKEKLDVTVTRWSAECRRSDLLPRLPGRMAVIDNRLRYAPEAKVNVSYMITDRQWQGVDKARQVLRDKAWQAQKKQHGRKVFLGLLVLALGPIIVFQIKAIWSKKAQVPA